MGGCRCVFRNCQSSTFVTPGLHYFHFPIRDPQRCEMWITNSRKNSLRAISKEKLRNKVICSLHFEERYFTNEKHDRLVHNAVPTLGCEDCPEEEEIPANNTNNSEKDDFILLIPTNEDNTKFMFPDVGFSGMSYTIYDDAVIPSSTVPLMANQNPNEKNKIFTVLRKSSIDTQSEQPKPKKPKFTVTSVNKVTPPLMKFVSAKIKAEPIPEIENSVSYSLSTDGDDLKLELSQKKDNFDQLIEQSHTETPLLDNDIALQPKGENEFSISVVSENVQLNVDAIEFPKINASHFDSESSTKDFVTTPEKEYIRMIQKNSKQIIELKRLINKQNRYHKHLVQKKQLCKFRRKPWDKNKLLDNLKKYIKPSLMAILKLEMLSVDEVMLSDSEEKFITDLYTQDPDCYNLLRKKYQWNLPFAETMDEQ